MERDVKSAVTQSSLHNNPYTREQTTTIQKKKRTARKKFMMEVVKILA